MFKRMMPAIHVAAMMTAARPDAILGPVVMDAGDDPEVLLKRVSAQLEKLNGEVKQTAETALKESKRAGEVSEETKATADKLLNTQTAMNKQVEELKAMVQGLDSKTLEISQQVAAGPRGRSGKVLSLGQAVVAQDDAIKSFLANGARGNMSLKINNAITTATGSAGGLIYNEEDRTFVEMPRRRLLIRDLLTQGKVSSDLVKYRKQVLRTNSAAMVAEQGIYPISEFGWDKATAQVKKVGHVTNISEEAMADADQLETEVDNEMRYGLDLEEERQILAGDGLGENLDGLLTEAPAFVAAVGLPNSTHIDRLRLAMLQVTLQDYMATAMVLSPVDWAHIEMLKVGSADNRYVYGNPQSGTGPMLWGKNVVESNTMTAGEWLVGDLALAATYYDRQETEVLISSENDTNFVEDMLTMKARKRVALAIKRTLAMVTGDFTFL